MKTEECVSAPAIFRPLTKDEIDQRIDGLIQTVTTVADDERPDTGAELRPRWITAAELVRRMQPFVVLN